MFTLYREGNTHEVNGIKCELKNVSLGELDEYRQNGWIDDVNELDPNYLPEVDLVKIGEALALLKSDNPAHFTENGYPKLDAVRGILQDETISKKDLNAAWKLANPQD